MKIFLCNPPTGHYIRDERCQIDVRSRVAENIREPIQLMYLGGLLQKRGYEIFLRDYSTPHFTVKHVLNDGVNFKPDCIYIETTQGTFKQDMQFIQTIHTSISNSFFIIKAPFFDFDSFKNLLHQTLTNNHIKIYFVVRNFEQTILDIIAHPHASHAVKNAHLWHKQKIILPAGHEHNSTFNIDDYPIPPRHLLNKYDYVRPDTNEPMAYIYVSKGCPYECIFCSAPVYLGRELSSRRVESVIKEIEECIKKYNIRNFFFRSDTFTIDREWVMQFCNAVIEKKLDIQWGTNSRTDTVDAEMLDVMKEAGCDIIGFGIESGSNTILEKIKKCINTQDVEQVHVLVKQAGIKTFFHCIIGFPWDTYETIKETKRFLLKVKPDFIEVNVPYPLKGTELYDIAENNNLFVSKDFEEYSHIKPILRTFTLATHEIEKLRKDILWSFYCRPAFIFEKCKYIRHPKIFLNYIKWGFNLVKKIIT